MITIPKNFQKKYNIKFHSKNNLFINTNTHPSPKPTNLKHHPHNPKKNLISY